MYHSSTNLKSNSELRVAAFNSMKENLPKLIAPYVVWLSILFMCVFMLNSLFPINILLIFFLCGPVIYSLSYYCLTIKRELTLDTHEMVVGFRYSSKSILLFIVKYSIIIICTMAFIVPGIIASLALSQCFFVSSDNPKLSIFEVMKESYRLTNGLKKRLIYLVLSFIPLILVGVITLGIGFVVVGPYMKLVLTHFYDDIRKRAYIMPN